MQTRRLPTFVSILLFAICSLQAQTDLRMQTTLDTDAAAQLAPTNYTQRAPESLPYRWKDLLFSHRLDVTDTSVQYPPFVEFCLNIYRWAENTFNTYDRNWVIGTGKHGKVRLVADNWLDTYYFHVPDGGVPMVMASLPYTNIGVAANYSILSASYSVDVNSLFTKQKSKYRKFQLAFTCARIYAEAYYWRNNGTTKLTLVEKEALLREHSRDFDGIYCRSIGLTGLYIFNSKKFSLAAAYNLSNYQLRSAGSWLLGIGASFHDIVFNFSLLPKETKDKAEIVYDKYLLKYDTYNVICGYSYNWVINRHWLFNVTGMPGAGLSFTGAKSTMGRRVLLATMARGQGALTYTNRQFFITASANYLANFILTSDVHTMSGIGNLQFSTGIRF